MNWGQAFLQQSKSDLDIFQSLLQDSTVSRNHALHYLQMATEKLCKVDLNRQTWTNEPKHSHYVLVPFLNNLKQVQGRATRKKLNYRLSDVEFGQHIDKLLPLAEKIQNLVPSKNDRRNCEYPWCEASGNVIVPCEHDYVDIVGNIEFENFVQLIKDLLGVIPVTPSFD